MFWLVAKYLRLHHTRWRILVNYLLPVLLLSWQAPTALALRWQDLWLTPDQQGQQALQAQQATLATTRFADPLWRAVAAYRAQDYQQCADILRDNHSALGYYNRGNALAQLGQYQTALTAYEQAIKLNPNDSQAKDNRELMRKLLQRQSSTHHQTAADNKQSDPSTTSSPSKQTANNTDASSTTANNSAPVTPQATNNNQTTERKSTTDEKSPDRPSLNPGNEQVKQQNAGNTQAKPYNNGSTQPTTKVQPLSQAQRALSRIDDDPGSLLRQKFLRDYDKIQQGK